MNRGQSRIMKLNYTQHGESSKYNGEREYTCTSQLNHEHFAHLMSTFLIKIRTKNNGNVHIKNNNNKKGDIVIVKIIWHP